MGKDCQRIEGLLEDYLEKDLVPDERERVAEHLRGCESCRGMLESLRFMSAHLRELPDPEPPDGFDSGVLSRLELLQARSRRARRLAGWKYAFAPVSILVAFSVVFVLLLYATPLSVLGGWFQEVYYRFFSWTGIGLSLSALSGGQDQRLLGVSGKLASVFRPLSDLTSEPVLLSLLSVLGGVLLVSVAGARFLVSGVFGLHASGAAGLRSR